MKMKHVTLASAVAFATLGLTACVFDGDSKASNHATVLPKDRPIATIETKAEDRLVELLKRTSSSTEIHNYTVSVNGKAVDKIDFSALGKGSVKTEVTEQYTYVEGGTSENKKEVKVKEVYDVHLFQQNYSSVGVIDTKEFSINGEKRDDIEYTIEVFQGVATEKLPTSGTFNYVGGGQFGIGNGEKETIENAKLSYSVNFDTQLGQGKVDGLSVGEITLNEAKIANFSHHNEFDGTRFEGYGLDGTAKNGNKQGTYHFAFFGPNADEISGIVDLDKHDIHGIVGGAKQ